MNIKRDNIAKTYSTVRPTEDDIGFGVPTLWLDTTGNKAYILVDVTTGVAKWTEIGGASAYDAQNSVLSIATAASVPPSETTGDRYILNGTPHANWDGAANKDIVEFDGDKWVATTPTEGMMCEVEDVNTVYIYFTSWTAWQNQATLTTSSPTFAALKVTTGAGAGKVYTSDADGDATWENAPTGTVPDPTTNVGAMIEGDGASAFALVTAVPKLTAMMTNPKAMAQGVALTAAASGSSGITVPDDADLNMGTNSFRIILKCSLNNWQTGAQQELSQKYVAYGFQAYISSANKIAFYMAGAGGVIKDFVASVANTLVAGTEHEIAFDITRETASVAGSLSLLIDGVVTETVTIAAGTGGSISNTGVLYFFGDSSVRTAGTLHSAYLYNRALSAAEVLSHYRNGLAEADKWGSQTSLSTGTIINGTDEPYETVDGASATGFHAINTAGANGSSGTPQTILITAGKWTQVSFSMAKASGAFPSFNLSTSIGGNPFSGFLSQTSVEGRNTYAFTPTVSGNFLLYWYTGASAATEYTVSDFSVKQIGATLALQPEGIQPDKWYDSSSNALDGAYPTTGSSLTLNQQLGIESLLSVTNVSLAANADTTLYTVPTGRRLVLTKAIVIAGADAGATTALSIGADGTETDFIPAAVLSNLDAANDTVILQPVPVAALPVKNKSYAAGTAIQAQVGTQSGGATNSLKLFGILY
jgi:hypothetical protein